MSFLPGSKERSITMPPPDTSTLNSSSGDKNTMSFVITPPKAAVIPVRGSDGFFPVHRIYCVGRNYAAHPIDMGHDPDRQDPFFFQKNPDNLVTVDRTTAVQGKSVSVQVN